MIPARFGSTRLPGKPLSDIHGKPMIQHVHERVRRARRPDRVLVCTDDDRIAAVVRGFGGEVVMTSRDHATGTDRLAEAARGTDAEIVVNVQGDEPLVDPDGIDAAVDGLERDPGLDMATLSLPLRDVDEMLSTLASDPALRGARLVATDVPDTDRTLRAPALAGRWLALAGTATDVRAVADVGEAVEQALTGARELGGPLLVAGSLYLVGHARALLLGEPPHPDEVAAR